MAYEHPTSTTSTESPTIEIIDLNAAQYYRNFEEHIQSLLETCPRLEEQHNYLMRLALHYMDMQLSWAVEWSQMENCQRGGIDTTPLMEVGIEHTRKSILLYWLPILELSTWSEYGSCFFLRFIPSSCLRYRNIKTSPAANKRKAPERLYTTREQSNAAGCDSRVKQQLPSLQQQQQLEVWVQVCNHSMLQAK